MVNIFFKIFSKHIGIYKSNFENQFCRFVHFTRKLVWGLYVCFGTFLRNMILAWWITWTTVFDYDIVATELSQGIGGELSHRRWKSLNLSRVWLVHSIRYYKVTLGFRDRSTVEFEVVYGMCMIFYWRCYFIILFWGKKNCVLYN